MPSTSDLTRQQPFAVTFLAGLNAAATALLVFAWPTLAPKLAAPFSWAFGHAISTQLSIWELPFMLMWLVPLLAAVGGWVLDSFDQTKWALLVLALPMMITIATMTLFKFFG